LTQEEGNKSYAKYLAEINEQEEEDRKVEEMRKKQLAEVKEKKR